ncbi:MAG: hypothetical protein M1570_06345 [Chloroflexi bacterium]|nr:hypothetical protein [Chloroflexota bacterium]
MDPNLTGPTTALGLPAAFWFIEFFKVLGFALHMVPMNLWYAGVVLAAILGVWGGPHGKLFSRRLMKQMPFIVAFGVNLGIVPLLFTQVGYYQAFYPSTILMAWPWFSVIGMLVVAYYGVYLYAFQLRNDHLTRLGLAAGWVSALLFTAIGLIFANNFSLMTNLAAWPALWKATSIAGAPLGIALNVFDPTLLPRWLMMFGLALTTVAAYMAVDAAFFAGAETDDYKHWASSSALKLCTLGIVWFAVTGTWYIFGAIADLVRAQLLASPLVVLTVLTAIAPGLVWALILFQRRRITRGLALATGAAQFVVIALNASSRQIVQNLELARYLDVTAQPVNLQLSPLVAFLVLFVAGLGVVAWMVVQVAQAGRLPGPTRIETGRAGAMDSR